MTRRRCQFLLGLLLCLGSSSGRAEVVRFEILERRPFADGREFGEAGAYDQVRGRVYFALDPGLRQNQALVDLDQVSKREGRVEFDADLLLLVPRDLSRGNRALLYDVNNRGNLLALRFFNDGGGSNQAPEPGNGFLMRQGYTIVWSGWLGELLPGDGRLQLRAPVADESVRGRVRYEICPDAETTRTSIYRDQHGAYRPTPAGVASATLTWRLHPGDARVPIPREQFRLHVLESDASDLRQLPKIELELPAGFRKGYLYELIYEACQPPLMGTGLAAIRDLIAALRHGEGADNPLLHEGQAAIARAYGFGVSQSGRCLREFVYSGFNEDERGRRVFDGLMPHVAGGGLGSFNHRFAQPSAYALQHENHDWPIDRFPFAYGVQQDPLSNRTDGILRRAWETKTAPKIMHTQSSTEYWSRSGSLVHTDPLGERDAEPLEAVRVYAFGGTQHGPASYPPSAGIGQSAANPADYKPLLRALLVALDRWCREQTPPPPSVHPRCDDGTLVSFPQASTGFPSLPGLRYPEVIQQPALLDWGSRWHRSGIIEQQPPRAGRLYGVRVPRCGTDGNERGCLLPPEVAVPLATFTGWNLRTREAGAENELVGLNGSFVPLAVTKAAGDAAGDPRPSLEERYGSAAAYQRELAETCARMVRDGYLLEEDVPRILERQELRAREMWERGR